MAFTAHSVEPRNRWRKYDLARKLIKYSDKELKGIVSEFKCGSISLFLKMFIPFKGRDYLVRPDIAQNILNTRRFFVGAKGLSQETADNSILSQYRPSTLSDDLHELAYSI